MEERNRKAPLTLNWGKLLPDEEDETPPEFEIVPDESLKAHSDSNLETKINRMRLMISSMKFNDGGVKLINKLKALEAELDRRNKIPKNVNKFKEVTAKSAYAGSNDSLSARARASSVSIRQSEFTAIFQKKFDDKRVNDDKDIAFQEDIVLLSRCNQNKRVNPHCSSKSNQRRRLSSISKPPKYISKLSNDRQSSGQFSDPLPSRIKRDPSPVYQKSCAPHFQAPRSSRQNSKTFVRLEENFESEATDPAEKLDESMKDTLFFYPSRDAPEAIEIYYSDVERLDPGRCLNSTIMNFYIQHLQNPTSPTTTKLRDYHFLNTYFYKKLRQVVLKKSDRESSFLKLRRWWRGVNIFEKAYIFIPVHESEHWSLIIICIPDREDESGPIVLHLDSLGMHNSESVCRDVKSFLIEEWKFLRQGDGVPELPIAKKVWEDLCENIDDRAIEVPQQGNEYDCGIFVLFFMERFIDEAPKRLKTKDLVKFGRQWFKPGDASRLRQRIRKLLIEEFKNANKVSIDLDP